MAYDTKMTLHLNYGSRGSSSTFELVAFPGVFVTDVVDSKEKKRTRTIIYRETEYEKIAHAVEAWKRDHGVPIESANP